MKIRSDIPIPKKKTAGRPRVYDFEHMNVGDSAEIDSTYSAIYSCIARFRSNGHKKWQFMIEKLEPKKVRVFRTA